MHWVASAFQGVWTSSKDRWARTLYSWGSRISVWFRGVGSCWPGIRYLISPSVCADCSHYPVLFFILNHVQNHTCNAQVLIMTAESTSDPFLELKSFMFNRSREFKKKPRESMWRAGFVPEKFVFRFLSVTSELRLLDERGNTGTCASRCVRLAGFAKGAEQMRWRSSVSALQLLPQREPDRLFILFCILLLSRILQLFPNCEL